MQLPDTLEDLSKFVLVGREKLNAVRAEIRAIEKVQLAAEVHQQKLEEAQEIAEAVLDAETKLGELTQDMEQAQGQRTDLEHSNSGVTKSKEKQLADIGLTKMQTSRYETLANHPEQVEKAKADARAEGKIVTRQDVFHKIAAECYPNKTQEAAQKLREAKKHHEEYMDSKADGIINFEDAVQDKSATKLIFEDFEHRISGIHTETLRIGSLISRDKVKDILRGADNKGLSHILEMAQEIHKQTVRLMREIAEVQDEK
jgi:hypothetical protein